MKWLEDNPVGMALAAISGVFALMALVMAIVWTLPVTAETNGDDSQNTLINDAALLAHQIGSLDDYQVINEKPVFNESRQPVMSDVIGDPLDDATVEVKDAPDVRLTGIIITPAMKIATLTAMGDKQKSIMAHEGQALTGEYVGWQISVVKARKVVLKSRDGRKLELDLQVHDVKIKQPPEPARLAKTAPGNTPGDMAEDGEPLSRAEQIRQRIAERREELRREQEDSQNENQASSRGGGTASTGYQNAIRSMMRNSSKDKNSDDKKDG
jgi:hypothetical protein